MSQSDYLESEALIGKIVRGDLYFHVSARKDVSTTARALMEYGSKIARLRQSKDFNVIKIGRGGLKVSLLFYADFFEEPFPKLSEVCTVDIANQSFQRRSYRPDGNPPILHKKELLLSPNHKSRFLFEQLTGSLEALGIRPDKPGSGFKRQWETYLGTMRVSVKNHQLMDL